MAIPMSGDEIRSVYAWLNPDALDAFIEAWPESGNADIAWAAVRADSRYEQWFPGNMTKDGRPRYAEDVYAAVTASYDDVFRSINMSEVALDQLRERYGELIAGDVSPSELEENRVVPMWDRIVSQSDAIRSFYAEHYGLEMTAEALMASAIDPDLGHRILTKQILVSEIGGEAAESGYSLDPEMLEKLANSGKVGRVEADRLFEMSENLLPTLNVLAGRHADPDDTFDLNEFINADIFQNPEERRRMNRLIAQERSTFTGSARTGMAMSREGSVVGLRQS